MAASASDDSNSAGCLCVDLVRGERGVPQWLLAYAPRETRTPTRDTPDKALNLARLPIPPQARVRSPIIGIGLRSAIGLDAVRPAFYLVRTHVRPRHNRAG